MREGHTGRELIVVVEGTLEVTRDGDHIADIGTGGFAGELALIGRTTRNATVATKTDASLIHIDGRAFDTLIKEIPEIAVKMLPIIAARVSGADDHDLGSGIAWRLTGRLAVRLAGETLTRGLRSALQSTPQREPG